MIFTDTLKLAFSFPVGLYSQPSCLNHVIFLLLCKMIFLSYANALHTMGVDSLYDRRENLCLSFAKKCSMSQNSQVGSMFPLMMHTLQLKPGILKNSK